MTRRPLASLAAILAALVCGSSGGAQELKAGAAAEILAADDAMVIGGGIGPGKARGQEGELRASAVVVEDAHGGRVALIACDVLMIERDVLDRAARRIERETRVPFDHVLINATHTHHAPTTVTVHGYERDEAFTRQVEDRIVQATAKAVGRLAPATCLFRLGEESSVGKNSRLLLGDGTIYWVGPYDDAVRPTGPFDPELPVLAFRRRDGGLEAVLFNHSTHTIGTRRPGVRSPSFYGLAAQELEKERGGTFLFFEGASGSTHNLDVPAAEAAYRVHQAVAAALGAAGERPVDRVEAIRKEIAVKVRHFREEDDDRAVVAYCSKRIKDAAAARSVIETFRAMRRKLAPRQGERARRGSRWSGSATWRSWASLASSSRRWGRRSSAVRPSATPASSSWPTTTSATSPTGPGTNVVGTRSGPVCTVTSSRGRGNGSSPRPSSCWSG